MEVGKEHTHETYAGKVGDGALFGGILIQGNAELVPLDRLAITITQRDRSLTDVRDEVLANHHVFGADTHLILKIALVLVKRVVLVDILDIGIGLIAGVIALCLLVVVGRVALRHIDTLVTLKDTGLAVVKVGATEIVIVIVGRVVSPCLTNTIIDVDLTQEIGIGRECTFLLVVQTVESDILQGT